MSYRMPSQRDPNQLLCLEGLRWSRTPSPGLTLQQWPTKRAPRSSIFSMVRALLRQLRAHASAATHRRAPSQGRVCSAFVVAGAEAERRTTQAMRAAWLSGCPDAHLLSCWATLVACWRNSDRRAATQGVEVSCFKKSPRE